MCLVEVWPYLQSSLQPVRSWKFKLGHVPVNGGQVFLRIVLKYYKRQRAS